MVGDAVGDDYAEDGPVYGLFGDSDDGNMVGDAPYHRHIITVITIIVFVIDDDDMFGNGYIMTILTYDRSDDGFSFFSQST